ncbi:MAG: hypothetical protein IJ347_02170 [Faecalibacterium sp.]|nr:hypothetical protein [Faecalibacterium sp.]
MNAGITLFNTGEFYQGSESEMVVGEAMKGGPRQLFSVCQIRCPAVSRRRDLRVRCKTA